MTSEQQTYIKEILEFTQRQIKINTGLEVQLSVAGYTLPKTLEPYFITAAIAEFSGISIEQLKGVRKPAEYVVVRMLVAFFLRRYFPQIKLREIAEQVGRDHTTIIDLLRNAEGAIGIKSPHFYPTFKEAEVFLENRIKQYIDETKN